MSFSSPSPALQAANARLLSLRSQARAVRQTVGTQAVAEEPDACPQTLPPASATATQPDTDRMAVAILLDALPPHLGWGSSAVTGHLRQSLARLTPTATEETAVSLVIEGANNTAPSLARVYVALHPTLALALLRQGQVPVGRLWLLLRWLDEDGRGWLARADIEAAFCDKGATTYLCTRRYLRQLLAAGTGLFWQQDTAGRVWLRGQTRVAADLGVTRLHGRTVQLPLTILFQSIGLVRAHFYASFHSSRGATAAPISRATLRDLSGVSPRAQQEYDRRARVRIQGCMAVGAVLTAVSDPQEHIWQHGRAAFTLVDTQGRQGKPGETYQARQLPNRYSGPHPIGSKPRRLNARLLGLCPQGDAGNGQAMRPRRYHADGAAAVRAWLRSSGQLWVYWPARGRGQMVWQEIPRLAA